MIPTSGGPLRIAMVCSGALPQLGGLETHVHEVCTRLGAAGLEVTVLTTDRSGRIAPPASPNWDDCADQLRRLYFEVAT
jgi:hypothetical protein